MEPEHRTNMESRVDLEMNATNDATRQEQNENDVGKKSCATLPTVEPSITHDKSSRTLTDVPSVMDFYSLLKEQVKPQGKLAKAPFEDFNMTLYKVKAHYTGFKTSPAHLLFWIPACYKVIYDDFGKNDNYFIDWNDKHDDIQNEFDHIMCKLYYGPVPDETKLKVILRIHFKSSCLTLQGLHYLWFISDVYPTIKDIFESLLGEHNPDPGE